MTTRMPRAAMMFDLGAVRPVVPVVPPRSGLRVGARMGNMLVVHAQHAFDTADHAADRGADHRADRAGNAAAFMKSMRGSARNALGLCRHWSGEECE